MSQSTPIKVAVLCLRERKHYNYRTGWLCVFSNFWYYVCPRLTTSASNNIDIECYLSFQWILKIRTFYFFVVNSWKIIFRSLFRENNLLFSAVNKKENILFYQVYYIWKLTFFFIYDLNLCVCFRIWNEKHLPCLVFLNSILCPIWTSCAFCKRIYRTQ